MRIIKFRGLDILGNWVYGMPQTSSTLHLTLDFIAQYFTEQRKYGRENVAVLPKTIGEFTGKKDKNGNEIYEGDIIKCYERVDGGIKIWYAAVKFSSGSWNVYNPNCCEACKSGCGYICELNECPGQIEVVGNIFQNSELLIKR